MQLEDFKERYPDAPDNISGWVGIYFDQLHIDGHYDVQSLRVIVDFAERVSNDFIVWYNEIRKLDSEMSEDPCNIFWHDFCKNKTPLEAYTEHGQMYGRN